MIKNTKPLVSIIIPAYNEEKRLAKTLDIYLDYFTKKYSSNYEILVILNGCKDRTEEIAQKYSQTFPTLQYYNFLEPIGKGGAIVEGYRVARGDLVAYSDADGSASPEMIEKLFEYLRQNPNIDCAIGSRNLAESKTQGRTKFRKILTKGFNVIVNLFFNLGIKDTQCGAKALKADTIKKILPNLFISGLSFDVNLLFEVKRNGGQIAEIPIEWSDDHDSTIKNPIKSSIVMFLSVLKLRIIYSPMNKIDWLLGPFSEIIWAILLTEQERKYRTIKH